MDTDGGLSVMETSKRLSLPKTTVENWIRASKAGQLRKIGKSQRPLTEIEKELAKVKRELSIAKMDRGRQYCAREYTLMLDRFGIKASMSRKGNCDDNAPMESFRGVLKNEQIHHCRYETRQAAIMDITEYIEIFYNRQRKQARLGFLSPAAFERWYHEKNWQHKIFGVHY